MDQKMTSHLSDLAAMAADGQHHHLQLLVREVNFSPNELDHCAHLAAYHGHPRCLQVLLASGADIHSVGPEKQSLLLEAIHSGDKDSVQTIIDAGFDVNRVNDDVTNLPPLHFAIGVKQDVVIAEQLLRAGCDLEVRDRFDDTSLIVASQYGLIEIVRLLISHGCVVNQHGCEGNTALHRAAQQGFVHICHYLLEKGADIQSTNDDLDTALNLACEEGHLDVTMLLIRCDATSKTICHLNREMRNALHLAARYGNEEFIEVLLKTDLNRNSVDLYGNTPFIIATCFQNEYFALNLLRKATNLNVNIRGETGRTALHWAAFYGMNVLTKSLLKRKDIEIDATDSNNDSPLTIACQGNKFSTLRLLLDHKADINIHGNLGRTVLHWLALTAGSEDLVADILLEHAIDVNTVDSSGDTALIIAASNRNYDIMKLLMTFGADLNIQGHRKRSAFHWLSENNCVKMIEKFLSLGAQIDLHGENNETPMLIAAKGSHQEMTCMLMENGADIESKDTSERNVLHYACVNNLPTVLSKALNKSASLANCVDSNGDTPLILAAENGHFELLDLLITHCDPNFVGSKKRTALFCCALHGRSDDVEKLLKEGADPNKAAGDFCPLVEASKRGLLGIVKMLVDSGAEVDNRNHLGRTPAMWSSQGGHIECLKYLHETGGANLRLEDSSGDTPLTISTWSCQPVTTEYIVPFSDLSHCEKEEGMDALHLAIVKENLACVEILISAGASINTLDQKENTCLHTAAKHNTGSEILRLLLTCGQDVMVNQTGEKGRTLLHWCIGDPESLDLVLPHKPDLDLIDENGASPLLLAIAHEQPLSAYKLINAGCDINMVYKDERQPIHHAAIYGDDLTTSLLLSNGVSSDTLTVDGRTPLLLACIEGHVKVVEVLLNHGCQINTVYFSAVTALSVAVDQRHYSVIRELLCHGADPNIIGPQKFSPIVNASIHGDMRGSVMLLQSGADIETAVEPNRHALYMAAFRKHYHIVLMFLSVICNVNFIRSSIKSGIALVLVDDVEVVMAMKSISSSPRSLKDLCRRVIRCHTPLPLHEHLKKIALSPYIQAYLGMEELSAFL